MAITTTDPVSGATILQSWGHAVYTDLAAFDALFTAYAALTAEWTDYTSSLAWTATTTNPVLGNGTKSAKYHTVGKTVTYAGIITMGSTTTFGTGSWLISAPANLISTGLATGLLYCSDAGTAANRIAGVITGASATTLALNVVGNVTSTSPFTWASGDSFRWLIQYETP